MDFSVSQRMRDVVDRVRDIVEGSIIPEELSILTRGFTASEATLETLRQKVKEAGLWAPQAPSEIGGMGLGLVDFGLVSEALGQSPLGHYVFGCQAPDAGNIEILFQFGTADQKARFLAPLVRGEVRSCFSMTEPDTAGSNPTQLALTAVTDGDDYIINGKKWFTTGADGATFAIVMAVTNPDAEPHARASQILVPTDTPGFELIRNIPIMGHAGDGWVSHGEIHYRGVRVPKKNLLGDEGAGFAIAQERLGPGRIHHCMRWIGICERAFSMMCARAAARDIGGRPLASKQIIQTWIAESRASINAARLMVLEAAYKIEHEGFYAARESVSLIKFFVAGVLMEVLDRAIQVHGALGITSDTVLSWWYVHERGARIYDGPDEVHKVAAARHILNRGTFPSPLAARRSRRFPPPRAAPRGKRTITDSFIDRTRAVREGEGLPVDALGAYLRDVLGGDGNVEVEQFPGGHSNLTYLVRFGGQEYVLRRPPFGANIKSAHDMGREHRVLSKLCAAYDKAPRPVLFCDDEAVIGAKFYLMERLYGVVLRKALPEGLRIDEDTARKLCETLADTLAELHAIDPAAIGLGDFGKPQGFIERQVSGWTRRYEAARTDDIAAVDRVATWLAETRPEDGRASLIHNDFKFDNLVLDPQDITRVIGILDWEMATTGDSLMDLGSSLGYWVEAGDPEPMHAIRFGPTHLPGMMTRRELCARYAERSGRDTDNALWFYCFGLFKTAVIAQQIYARFARGHTKDPRFAKMILGVRLLAEKAQASIASGSL